MATSSGSSEGRGKGAEPISATPSRTTGAALRTYCAVTLPGRVGNPEKAVSCLGGRAAVQVALQNPGTPVRMRLCEDYKWQAPIPMKPKTCCDLLVRVKKRPDGSYSNEILGLVTSRYTVDSLADYTYAPGQELNYGGSTVVGSLESELRSNPSAGSMYIPPPFYTGTVQPQAYNAEDNSFVRAKRRAGTLRTELVPGTSIEKVKAHWISVSVRKFHSDQGPPDAPPEGAVEQLSKKSEHRIVEAMRELFHARPMWLKAPLEEQLDIQFRLAGTVSVMQKCLMCVAYYWSDGPFRGSYARLGFDPRSDPRAMRLQVIDFRDKSLSVRLRVDGTVGTNAGLGGTVDCHFRRPPAQRSQLYQLHDVDDAVVQRLLLESNPLEAPSEKSGWLPQNVLVAIRSRMQVKADLMRRVLEAGGTLPALPSGSSTPPFPLEFGEQAQLTQCVAAASGTDSGGKSASSNAVVDEAESTITCRTGEKSLRSSESPRTVVHELEPTSTSSAGHESLTKSASSSAVQESTSQSTPIAGDQPLANSGSPSGVVHDSSRRSTSTTGETSLTNSGASTAVVNDSCPTGEIITKDKFLANDASPSTVVQEFVFTSTSATEEKAEQNEPFVPRRRLKRGRRVISDEDD